MKENGGVKESSEVTLDIMYVYKAAPSVYSMDRYKRAGLCPPVKVYGMITVSIKK